MYVAIATVACYAGDGTVLQSTDSTPGVHPQPPTFELHVCSFLGYYPESGERRRKPLASFYY